MAASGVDGSGYALEIQDCGEGFDFDHYKVPDPKRILHSHGRGVLMANSLLELEYLPPGNRVKIEFKAD